jgi:prepilin-type N-terminal cleavage/methylation domain-containing protein
MKRPISSGQPGRRRGFSLVEVVIALGVITVGFVAVLGVFPAALQTGHSAQDETRAAHIAQSVFGSLVASAPSHFTNAQLPLYPSPSPAPTPLSIDLTVSSSPTRPTVCVDNNGNLAPASPTDPACPNYSYALYIFTNNSVPGFTDPASANAVTVRVAWPANAPAANQTFRDYVRIVSKY